MEGVMGVSGLISRRGRASAPGIVGVLLLLIATLLLSVSPPALAKRDTIPPTFAGLQSATTCTPGPIGGGRTGSYHLSWDPATDNRTPSGQILYDVYQATAPGAEDFSVPTYTTPAGATSFDTPQLPAEQTFYFVVRARDRAGNSDSNKVERQGQNLCV
jgi:hypothetical protein